MQVQERARAKADLPQHPIVALAENRCPEEKVGVSQP